MQRAKLYLGNQVTSHSLARTKSEWLQPAVVR